MTQFVIDLLDGSNNRIGSGPLENVLSVSVGEKLDEAGPISFSVPATDVKAATLIDTAARFRVRFTSGKLVYGIITGDTLDATADAPTRVVTGADMLQELQHYSMGWWCYYDEKDINTVILPELLADTPFTAGTIDASLGTLTYLFDGDSRLAALLKIAQATGKHFRLGTTLRTLDFGAFGTATTVRLTNLDHIKYAQGEVTDHAIIGALQVTSDRGPVVNRIIPWGAGNDGADQYRAKVSLFHLDPAATVEWSNIKAKHGVRGTMSEIDAVADYLGVPDSNYSTTTANTSFHIYPINQLMWCYDPDDLSSGFGYDMVVSDLPAGVSVIVRGSPTIPAPPTSFPAYLISHPQLYIQDDTAWAADPHEAVIIFNDISLPNLSLAAFEAAAMQLYKRAWYYLQAHKVPQVTYTLEVLNLPESLRVGDTVPVVYRGAALWSGTTTKWIDVNATLNVIGITRTYNADGSTRSVLEVSNIARQPSDLSAMLGSQITQTGAMGVTVGAPTIAANTVTGVAVDLAEVHAALVTLGLITT